MLTPSKEKFIARAGDTGPNFKLGKQRGRYRNKPQYILCLVNHTAKEKKPMPLQSP